MASSSMQVNAHNAPVAPGITPPGNSSQPTLKNLPVKLNHEWTIEEPISKENQRHAVVYSVLISATSQLVDRLEAHVFALDDIEPKLQKHLQRCIEMMKDHTELEAKLDGCGRYHHVANDEHRRRLTAKGRD